ncbi:MAG: class I SAM-dependent methyltransferase [Acidimicrobiia bacterium]
MASKIVGRISDRPHAAREREAIAWAAGRAHTADEVGRAIDPEVWNEAQEFGARLDEAGRRQLAALEEDPRQGGAHAALLYFLVRITEVETAVETGVALGYSTAAILGAMCANGRGHLYSSDFPAFRHRDPERHIGCLVDDNLRDRWTLDLRGDRKALERIGQLVDKIDLFHYDSDKTYRARERAVRRVEPLLAPDAVMMMDDIQDNLFFREHVETRGADCEVVEYEGKYLGIVGVSLPRKEAG